MADVMQLLCCTNDQSDDSTDRPRHHIDVPTLSKWKAVGALLLVFTVYVGVQVVSQAFPVLIPAGMRCYDNQTQDCIVPTTVNKSLYKPSSLTYYAATTSGEPSICHTSAACMEITDVQQALLTGLTFTSVYLVAGIPLARAATIGSRVLVLAIGLFFLVVMTVVAGFSYRFIILWVARLGVGFGEAACSPAAYSLLSDYFLSMNRAKAISFYHFATNLGVALAYTLVFIDSALCWRWVFFCLSICGAVLLLLVIIFLREPPYDSSDTLLNSRDIYTLKESAYRLTSNRPYVLLCSASAMHSISTYTLWAWLPTFYARVLQSPVEEYGLNIALIVVFGGGLGCLIGAVCVQRIFRRKKQYTAYTIGFGQLTAASFILGAFLVPSRSTSYCLLFFACLSSEISPGPTVNIIQDLFAMNLRSQASTAYIAVTNIIGGAVGPILIPAIMAFHIGWHSCDQGLGVALAIVVPVFYVASSILYTLTGLSISKGSVLNEETIYLKYENSEFDNSSDSEKETTFYGSNSSLSRL